MPKANPLVYLELSIGEHLAGRITFKLFADTVPKTAENFRALCTGEQGHGLHTRKPLHLKDTLIYRIIRGFVAQGGDLSKRNGLVGESIYGGTFIDENFKRKHDKRGLLSMANSGPHSNESHFFITLNPLPNLDGKHVVFGEVVHGVELLDQLEAVCTDNGKPSQKVLISACGEVDTKTRNEILGIKGEVDAYSSYEDSNAGHRKRSPGKNKHTQRKKKKHHYSDTSSDDNSNAGRKRRRSHKNEHKSSKRRKHRDNKSGGSRKRSRRNPTSSSDDSRDTR